MTGDSQSGKRSRLAFVLIWLLAVTFVAAQWFLYDAAHKQAEHFSYYILTLLYLSGALSPLVLWLSRRWPIGARTWKRTVPVHVAASLLVTSVSVFIEGAIAWFPHAARWSFLVAQRHYFTQHTQIGLATYWVLVAGVHFYRAYDQYRVRELRASRLETQLAAAHLNSLRAQLQPHFLFNTLQAAATLIYADPEGAEEMLVSLSELLRTSLRSLDQQEITLRDEIAFLERYAAIQQRRFGDRLRFAFHIHEEASSCAVPSLLLQPLVENAVQHGIGVRKMRDVISIRAAVQADYLTVQVENLSGLMGETLETLVSRGVGLSNTIARLRTLYGADHTFSMHDLSPAGVAVSISIPARHLSKCQLQPEARAVS